MNHIEIYRPADERFIKLEVERRGLDPLAFEGYVHPREDYHAISKNKPIFVVADGVTLPIVAGEKYPDPSPAGELTKSFCARMVSELESGVEIKTAFAAANRSVAKFNAAATTAFVRIKDNLAEWGSVCDSYIFHFDKDRNFLTRSPSCKPYAVVNGETEVEDHLNTGSFELKSGELLAICTDGFEHYLSREKFLEQTFVPWETETSLAHLESEFIALDPDKYGHERTLVLVWA